MSAKAKEDSEKKDEAAKVAAEDGKAAVQPDPAAEGGETSAATKDDAAKDDAAKASPPPAEPDWKDLYARMLADFDNYKKRAARDREDSYRYAEADIFKDILGVVDNLALALEHAPNQEDEFVKGVRLVYDGLLKALADHGVKPMGELVGTEMDPNLHEAIATLPSAEVAEGKISNVVKTGWLHHEKLLRAAQVVVSSGAPAAAPTKE